MLFKGPLLHKVWDLVVFLCPIGQYWLGWFAFFYAFANIAGVFGFSFLVCHFLNAVFFKFPKKTNKKITHVFMFLARHFYLWRVSDELKVWAFTQSEVLFYWKVAGVNSVRGSQGHKNDFLGFCVRWAVWVLSAVQWRREHTLPSLPTHLVPAMFPSSHQLCLSSVFLFTPSSFDCYLQLTESTFSTCAIQRYFSISLYSFWGFWCTFFMICVILVWW